MTFELDHVFIAASPGAPEMELLTEAGFRIGPVREHAGQGTASRGVFFENAYLELIWLTNREEAGSSSVARTRLAERVDPGGNASPFGFGIRASETPVPEPPFGTWPYRPPYLPEGQSFLVGVNSEAPGEPLIFVLPRAGGPSWDPLSHENGARRMTGVSLVTPACDASAELEIFRGLGLIDTDVADVSRLEIVLDEGRQGHRLDLRPHLPLLMTW